MSLSSKAAILGGSAIGAVAVGLGAAVVASDEYYNAMKQVQAGTGATADEMKEIKEISKNLYNNNLGEDWNDLAAAIQEVKSVTDLSGQSLETATKYAIQYRDVFGEDVTESIKASDTMMKNFGITAEQSYNLLAQGAQQGLNKSQELLDSANEYSVYFKTLGYDANEMFDIFNTGLENGAFNLLIWALWWRHHIETSLTHGTHLTSMTKGNHERSLEKGNVQRLSVRNRVHASAWKQEGAL